MKIAILEDNTERQTIMRACLADRFYMYDSRFFDDARAMIGFLGQHMVETLAIGLDHDLELKTAPTGECVDPGTGREVADYLSTQTPVCPVVIHTSNSTAGAGMELVLKDAGWNVRRVLPFDDMNWIATQWFPVIRRAIVGPIGKRASARAI